MDRVGTSIMLIVIFGENTRMDRVGSMGLQV